MPLFEPGLGPTATRRHDRGPDHPFEESVVRNDRQPRAYMCREIGGPVNILALKGIPGIKELGRLGVRRVSVGSGMMRAAMTLVRRAATELLQTGTYSAFAEGAISHAEMNKLLDRRA